MTRPPDLSSSRLVAMRPRDPDESGRTATTLELFFDLVFVVAVSVAAVDLHHDLAEGHFLEGLGTYAVVFFGIWWAWMNFTWFATSFDTDDWLYRVVTIVQMAGVLVLAAGCDAAFADGDFTVLVYGYVIMRVAMVTQWLRASRGTPNPRTTYTYAAGIAVVQVLWLAWLRLSAPASTIVLIALIAAELAIPVVAERRGSTPWHPHHITERYGLFTLILLGESLLASSNAILGALHDEGAQAELFAVAALALVVTAALWWIYFWPPHHELIGGLARSIRYGYGHYFVFAAAGAFSAGIEVEVAVLTHHAEISETAAAFCIAVPIAVFMLGIWWIAIRESGDRVVNVAVPLGAVLVLLDPLAPIPISLTALILVLVVAVLVAHPPIERADADEDPTVRLA